MDPDFLINRIAPFCSYSKTPDKSQSINNLTHKELYKHVQSMNFSITNSVKLDERAPI